MPYTARKQGDEYVVYKKDTGERVGATAGNKEALRKYMAALHINAKESKVNELRNAIRTEIQKLFNKNK